MREPNIETLKKLATMFNVSIDYLFGRTPDVFVDDTYRETLDISAIKDKYNFTKKRIDKIKEIYKNDTTLSTAINELCCGVGKTTLGETITNTNISMLKIDNIFNDFENSKNPKPQIMMKIKDLENSIIIVEIDSFDDEEIPFDATDRITYHSNAIEGSTLTYAETYAILYNDNSFKIEGKEPREIYEAINHKKALEL